MRNRKESGRHREAGGSRRHCGGAGTQGNSGRGEGEKRGRGGGDPHRGQGTNTRSWVHRTGDRYIVNRDGLNPGTSALVPEKERGEGSLGRTQAHLWAVQEASPEAAGGSPVWQGTLDPSTPPPPPAGSEGPQYARISSLNTICHPICSGTPPVYLWIKGIVDSSS